MVAFLLNLGGKIVRKPRALLFAAVVVILINPRTIAWLAERTYEEFSYITKQNIIILDVLILLAGLALWFWDNTRRAYAYVASHPWLHPRVPKAVLRPAVPLAVLAIGIVCAGLYREQLPLFHPASLLLMADYAASVILIAAASYLVFIKLFRHRAFALAALVPYAGLLVFEAVATPLFGMRFDPALLGLVDANSLRGIFMPSALLLASVASALIIWAAYDLRKLPREPSWMAVWQICLMLGLVLACRFGYVVYRVASAPVPARFKNQSESIWMSDYRREPLTNALAAMWSAGDSRGVRKLNPDECALAARLGLGLGNDVAQNQPVLPGKAPQRVVMVFCESLTLDFLGKYNTQMPESLTPFIDSMPGAFHELLACSFPTDAALATHFCSHPNYNALYKLHYPNSIVRMLRDAGWKTAIFQSANLAFNKDRQRYSMLGFSEMYGAEWQADQGRGALVSGWGACDRLTFDSAVDYIKAHHDEHLFVTLLTIDTHFPHGRENYGEFKYPESPAWVRGHPQERLLRAVFRQDYDIGLLYNRLNAEGLLDEDTLFILTADHAFPDLPALGVIPGMGRGPLRKIPFIISCGQNLPVARRVDQNASQTATAPTLAHLLGIPQSNGWFGRSLFAVGERDAPSFVWSVSGVASKRYPTEVEDLFKTVLISDADDEVVFGRAVGN